MVVVTNVQVWDTRQGISNKYSTTTKACHAVTHVTHRSKKKDYYYQTKYMGKNYNHFTHTNTETAGTNYWIDNLLAGDGITEYRSSSCSLLY